MCFLLQIAFLLRQTEAHLSIKNDVKDTPLHVASRYAPVEAVIELLDHRARLGIRNAAQELPFHT